jgi:hypothetical protein
MVSPTVPYGLPLFDDTSAITPWQAPFNAISNGLNTALGLSIPVVADLDALKALVGMPNGADAFVTEGGATFSYISSLTKWVQQSSAAFTTAAARDTAYAKAGGIYKVAGISVFRQDYSRTEQYLTASTTIAVTGWYPITGSVPTCRVGLSAAQNSTTSTAGVGWDTEQIDTDGFHTTTGSNSRLTIPTGLNGTFKVAAQVVVSLTSGVARIQIYKNGSLVSDSLVDDKQGSANANPVTQINYEIQLFAGDFIEIAISNSVGTAALIPSRCWALLRYLGPL